MISRTIIAFVVLLLSVPSTFGQQMPNDESAMEAMAEEDESDFENDDELLRLNAFVKNRMNINTVSISQLTELGILSEIQLNSFHWYRLLFGRFISMYELQAIPGWDIEIIRRILPFISLQDASEQMEYTLRSKIAQGDKMLMVRYGQLVEKPIGYQTRPISGSPAYQGGRGRLMVRLQSNFKNHFQYGIVADKDAGEQFAFPRGFDFYSMHLFISGFNGWKTIAVGDFTINLGQGLIHWQSQGFSKSASVLSVKKQSAMARPYRSGGESNFHRGIALVKAFKNFEAGIFLSNRKQDANLDQDTARSLITGGYHRTVSEINNRKSLGLLTSGGSVRYKHSGIELGINAVLYKFSNYIQKRNEPYNQFSGEGSMAFNYSVDYGYTVRNFHTFGEFAVDKKKHAAFLTGLILSLDPKIDAAILHRNYGVRYQSYFSRGFGEGSIPANERGTYFGLSIRPVYNTRIDVYVDFFSFPWLRFRVDAPSSGSEYLLQVTHKPTKKIELYSRVRVENKSQNLTGDPSVTRSPIPVSKINWRTNLVHDLSGDFSMRHRIEWVLLRQKGQPDSEGILVYSDLLYRPMMQPWSASLRLQLFDTDDFSSRVYAFENDLPFSFSIPMYYDRGVRYYINVSHDLHAPFLRKLRKPVETDISFRWSQTIYPGSTTISSGLNQIQGNSSSDFRFQVIFKWQ